MHQPHHRSRWRAHWGAFYFTQKRYFQWFKNWKRYSRTKTPIDLPYILFSHQTPLYRQLRDVDQWLQDNKVINLNIALKKINNITIKPGETFSYWYTIGNPTKRKGYVPGMILQNVGFTSAIGGGLCQLSNLLHWITLHSPLTITERWRHGYDVFPDSNRTQPFGSGATCSYNYIDLQIKNTTTQTFQFKIYLTAKYLVGEIRSHQPPMVNYEVYEKEHRFIHEPWGGYSRHNQIWRKVINSETNELHADEFCTENHAIMMYEPLLK
jgi:vancomycin resistance protein VanW